MISFWWYFIAYWVVAIGVWRWKFADSYVVEAKSLKARFAISTENAKRRALADPGVWFGSLTFALFWPLVLVGGAMVGVVFVVVVWPATQVAPLIRWWWMRSANRQAEKAGLT